MICWGLGAFGLGLTGMLETNTKEDMGEHSELIILWAANLTSQPNTARHLLAAKRRGAHIVTIDVRRTEAAAKSDDVLLIRPGADTALALAMMHVICTEQRHDAAFVAANTVGYDRLAAHLRAFSPAWAADITGIAGERIVALARRYAATRPAMIVLGGSSMHKGAEWLAGGARDRLPTGTDGERRHSRRRLRTAPWQRRPRPRPRRHHGAATQGTRDRDAQSDVVAHGVIARRPHPDAAADGHEHVVVICRHGRGRSRVAADPADRELRPLPQRYGAPLCRYRPASNGVAGGVGMQDDAHASLPDGASARAAR